MSGFAIIGALVPFAFIGILVYRMWKYRGSGIEPDIKSGELNADRSLLFTRLDLDDTPRNSRHDP